MPNFPAGRPKFRTMTISRRSRRRARLGVQRKVVDEATRRKRQRLLAACGVAVVVAGALVFLIEKFYDPEAWAREKAIKEQVALMAEKQKVTDDLTHIEIDIEDAITKNELDAARANLALLIEKSPDHPRREFLQTSIDRARRAAEVIRSEPRACAGPVAARPKNSVPAERAPSKAASGLSFAPRAQCPDALTA
jgi:dGTP triphosphohydrolase